MSRKETTSVDGLDWIEVSDNRLPLTTEAFTEKLCRKVAANPVVPIGFVATIAALTYGLYSFSRGNSMMSQYMMRARVGAQAITILSIAIGLIFTAQKKT